MSAKKQNNNLSGRIAFTKEGVFLAVIILFVLIGIIPSQLTLPCFLMVFILEKVFLKPSETSAKTKKITVILKRIIWGYLIVVLLMFFVDRYLYWGELKKEHVQKKSINE